MHFALAPGTHQPSGSINMSRLDSVILTVKFKRIDEKANVPVAPHLNIKDPDNVTTNSAKRLKYIDIFAVNWNWLRIDNGQSGLLFSN